MKRVLFLRHAKALPPDAAPDHERELAPRGLAAAAEVGRSIAAGGWVPDAALVSDAKRTQQTFAGLLPFLDPAPVLRLEPRLYEAAPSTILMLLTQAKPATACLLVIGHNPGLAVAVLQAASDGAEEDLARLRSGFPPAALAVLSFDVDAWANVAGAPGHLDALLWPEP